MGIVLLLILMFLLDLFHLLILVLNLDLLMFNQLFFFLQKAMQHFILLLELIVLFFKFLLGLKNRIVVTDSFINYFQQLLYLLFFISQLLQFMLDIVIKCFLKHIDVLFTELVQHLVQILRLALTRHQLLNRYLVIVYILADIVIHTILDIHVIDLRDVDTMVG